MNKFLKYCIFTLLVSFISTAAFSQTKNEAAFKEKSKKEFEKYFELVMSDLLDDYETIDLIYFNAPEHPILKEQYENTKSPLNKSDDLMGAFLKKHKGMWFEVVETIYYDNDQKEKMLNALKKRVEPRRAFMVDKIQIGDNKYTMSISVMDVISH